MNATSFFAGFVVLASSLAAVGCASEPSEPVAAESAELSTCTPAKYEEALAQYKNAVAWSKERLEHGICETEHGYLMTIADEASRAVTTCGAFRETIKSSPFAAPIREALGPSLTLRSITGELLVIKDSEFQNWNGVDALLGRGVTFWANAVGAYGHPYQIDLRANGDATWGYLHYDEKTDFTWRTEAARYTITPIGGATSKRKITVTRGEVTESFVLSIETDSWMTEHAPVFSLTPLSPFQPTTQKLFSMLSECDA